MKHKLPELIYSYSDLEPYIDAQTMEIHHSKHHLGYVNKLNSALEGYSGLQELSVEDLLSKLDTLPTEIKTAVRNNGGGHANHSLFWSVMTPKPNEISDSLNEKLTTSFGNVEKFKEQFELAATSQFGSGWTWLVLNETKNLEIMSTSNQDSPLSLGMTPILGLDVWEHAYYLKYKNKRAEYVKAWWNVVDWEAVNNNFTP